MPRTFSVTLNKECYDLLVELNGNYGDKTEFMRLALATHLIRMKPIAYALARSQDKGPHPYKVSFNVGTKQTPKWYEALKAKAAALGTTPAQLARVCLCQFLDDLKESGKEHEDNL